MQPQEGKQDGPPLYSAAGSLLLRDPRTVPLGCPSPKVSVEPRETMDPNSPAAPQALAALGVTPHTPPISSPTCPPPPAPGARLLSPGTVGQPEADRTGAWVCGD